jgi:hypothetical protein
VRVVREETEGPGYGRRQAGEVPAVRFENADEFGFMDPGVDEYDAPAEPDRVPCPACGEMIVATAAKCRFCGEDLNEATPKRAKKKKKARSSSAEDADLSTGDWIFCILCSGIACIFGLVYMIQGKPKGAKMMGIAFAASAFWTVVRTAIELAMKQQQP